ncbi:MAG: hypothetical protein JF618_13970 [Leifsonia sp.]|nr:hypothetical protein [Leifsonia sp.]
MNVSGKFLYSKAFVSLGALTGQGFAGIWWVVARRTKIASSPSSMPATGYTK